MENASKALIIAGSILVAILLISVGLIILNSTKGVTDQGKRSADLLKIEANNSNFTKYCGDRVLGSQVRDLISFKDSYNATNDDDEPDVSVTGETSPVPNVYYKVEVTVLENGYIKTINVSRYW